VVGSVSAVLLAGLDPKVRFQLANSIWYCQDWSFEKESIGLNKTYFDAQVMGLDFDDPGAGGIIPGPCCSWARSSIPL